MEGGFNPCFSGYLCSGDPLKSLLLLVLFVSILVFLDTSVPGLLDFLQSGRIRLFQSLFFWIPLFRELLAWPFAILLKHVSILVFLDTSVPGLTRYAKEEERERVSILVFLDTSVPG